MIRHALVAMLVLAAPAGAQETRASAAAKFHREFAASDRNADGALSRTEVQARIDHMTSTASKLTPVQKQRLATLWFTRADADKDGKVTEREAQALLVRTFDRYDANRDGRVGAGEKDAARKDLTGR